MTIIQDHAFCNEEVILDHNHFKHCTFDGCELTYHGNGLTEMTDCTLTDVSVSFAGPARKTLSFLDAISDTELVGVVLQVAQQFLGSKGPKLLQVGDEQHLLHWPQPPRRDRAFTRIDPQKYLEGGEGSKGDR